MSSIVKRSTWIGVEVVALDGSVRAVPVVEAGVPLPHSVTVVVGHPQLTRVRIPLFLGGAEGTTALGEIELAGLAPGHGSAELRVDLTSDGRVRITLTDPESGRSESAILPLPAAFLPRSAGPPG